jgi:hypothetical protein
LIQFPFARAGGRRAADSVVRARVFDRLGIGLASLCLVHCLALPLIVSALPMLATALHLPEQFHVAMVLLAVPLSGVALVRGYAMHRRVLPALAGGAALALLVAAVAFAPDKGWETGLTVVASLMLAGAHLWNLRQHC